MVGKFYGLTGVNLVLSKVNPIIFKKLIKSSDNYTLGILKIELEHIRDFLDNVPMIYESPEARRAEAILKAGRYNSEEEKEQYEKILENSNKIISTLMMSKSSLNKLSDCSYDIIKELSSRRSMIDFYLNNLSHLDGSDVVVFGTKLFVLKTFKLSSLFYKICRMYDSSPASIEKLKVQLDTLEKYILHNDTFEESEELLIDNMETMSRIVNDIGVNYFNDLFQKEYNLEDYHKSSLELVDVGLVGFSPFSDKFFEDFSNTVIKGINENIQIKEDDALYKVYELLKDVVDNYSLLGKEVV